MKTQMSTSAMRTVHLAAKGGEVMRCVPIWPADMSPWLPLFRLLMKQEKGGICGKEKGIFKATW